MHMPDSPLVGGHDSHGTHRVDDLLLLRRSGLHPGDLESLLTHPDRGKPFHSSGWCDLIGVYRDEVHPHFVLGRHWRGDTWIHGTSVVEDFPLPLLGVSF